MTGILLRIEDATPGCLDITKPNITYQRWRLVYKDKNGAEKSVCTGRLDIIKRAERMINQKVNILQAGKCGIVGGIRLEL